VAMEGRDGPVDLGRTDPRHARLRKRGLRQAHGGGREWSRTMSSPVPRADSVRRNGARTRAVAQVRQHDGCRAGDDASRAEANGSSTSHPSAGGSGRGALRRGTHGLPRDAVREHGAREGPMTSIEASKGRKRATAVHDGTRRGDATCSRGILRTHDGTSDRHGDGGGRTAVRSTADTHRSGHRADGRGHGAGAHRVGRETGRHRHTASLRRGGGAAGKRERTSHDGRGSRAGKPRRASGTASRQRFAGATDSGSEERLEGASGHTQVGERHGGRDSR
jgi:hypothetical protein